MDGLLTEIKKTTVQDDAAPSFVIQKSQATTSQTPSIASDSRPLITTQNVSNPPLDSLDAVISTLKAEPDLQALRAVLQRCSQSHRNAALNITIPGPSQAKVVYILIENALPTFWQSLSNVDRLLLAQCLTSVAGINAILAKLRKLCVASKQGDTPQRLLELLQLLTTILDGRTVVSGLWSCLAHLQDNKVRHVLMWKEVVNIFGSGKLISVPAEAYEIVRTSSIKENVRLMNGADYTEWLAGNVLFLAAQPDAADAAVELFSKAMSLGYNDALIPTITRLAVSESTTILSTITSKLTASTKRRYLQATISWLSSSLPGGIKDDTTVPSASHIATLLRLLTTDDDTMLQQLAEILADPSVAATSSLALRQAALSLLSLEPTFDFSGILEKAMLIFGDQLFIDHTPSQQQDALAQIILISAGILHRSKSALLLSSLRSAKHLQAVSNRLASSGPRARWLGMIVGTALSRLTDKPGTTMNFGTSDMETSEAEAWLSLPQTSVQPGDIQQLLPAIDAAQRKRKTVAKTRKHELPLIDGKQTFGPIRPPSLAQTEIQGDRITELDDDAMDEDDDLVPYAKPGSDPEDSDDDATLVNRNKPRPPVYIRTLMAMLRDTENADKFQMALKHAAPLIRRKTGFGREVSDHAEELARILANLQDPFETDDFDTQRLQALIAIVLSDVQQVAPWLARQAFAKDYSIAQRAIMLTALGLSGRELAGFKHEDQLNVDLGNTSFPSKQLPARLHGVYAPPMLEGAARAVEASMIQPMALAAADQTTSHLDAVKVRKFSSRLDVERTRRKPAANELAKLFYTAFFGPLISAFQQNALASGNSAIYMASPVLLTTFLKTVALLLHAAGPATSQLDQVTAEFWELLLYLRIKAVADVTIMEALLFSCLTLLEVNGDKQSLAMNNPKQLMETKEWAEMVFERTGGGNLIEGEGEEARVRTLCAGVLTKIGDIISQYQKQLMGGWSGS